MSASLEDRVALFISDHPGSTLPQVCAAIHRRAADIRRVLNSGAFYVALDIAGAKHYFLASTAQDGPGRASDRLLDGAAGQFGGADGSAASSSGRPPQATHPAAPSQLELLPPARVRREYAA